MGLVAVAYSILVSRRLQSGDAMGAAKASHLARAWCLATLVAITVIAVIWGLTGVRV
jgi:Interferon-induced transmembrane protein